MICPFCGLEAPGIWTMTTHLADKHEGLEVVLVPAVPPAAPASTGEFPGVDIDAVHLKRRPAAT